ncbi:hypothetical protein EDB81DRAFT_788675 [Dactylonectria macrodidyma]|uniref:EamA domain-containing protein n=1 Tax=Dactylonectria macrodidyma TaxID=307937 RepID=A0A9P9FAA7_9HYPO|nr:hypothetical protein EDB81DRAFT_788675 [Dactylonectria macrodidyma]
MAGEPGTPTPYHDTPQTPLTKLAPRESGDESRDHLLPPNARSPNMGASKLNDSSFDDFRRLSLSPAASPLLEPIPLGRFVSPSTDAQVHEQPSWWQKFWVRNKPSICVALSQLFGSLMNLSARLVELEGNGMHPVQVLLLRQLITSLCCTAYMWWMKTPGFPFGPRNIQHLLVFRGVSGFFGIFGVWYSMMYIPLADATVITFLAPGVAGLICYFVLKEPFTRLEQLATLVALMGVVLIAKPGSFFASQTNEEPEAGDSSDSGVPGSDHVATAEERLIAVGVALFGVLGAAGAFTALRTIGKRAHPLISVNYFGVISTIISVLALGLAPVLGIDQPGLKWITPSTAKQWLLLLPLGLMGFIMQYLLTTGLGSDKSNRANAMIYTHMLFAVSFDRWVFGHRMDLMSGAGCTLILGSAIGVMLMKKAPPSKPPSDDEERLGNLQGELEGSPMLLDPIMASEEPRVSR